VNLANQYGIMWGSGLVVAHEIVSSFWWQTVQSFLVYNKAIYSLFWKGHPQSSSAAFFMSMLFGYELIPARWVAVDCNGDCNEQQMGLYG